MSSGASIRGGLRIAPQRKSSSKVGRRTAKSSEKYRFLPALKVQKFFTVLHNTNIQVNFRFVEWSIYLESRSFIYTKKSRHKLIILFQIVVGHWSTIQARRFQIVNPILKIIGIIVGKLKGQERSRLLWVLFLVLLFLAVDRSLSHVMKTSFLYQEYFQTSSFGSKNTLTLGGIDSGPVIAFIINLQGYKKAPKQPWRKTYRTKWGVLCLFRYYKALLIRSKMVLRSKTDTTKG